MKTEEVQAKVRAKLHAVITKATRARAREIAKEIHSFLLQDMMQTAFSTEDEARFRRKIAAIVEKGLR